MTKRSKLSIGTIRAALWIASLATLTSCSKKSSGPTDLRQDTITVESIIQYPPDNTTGDISPSRRGFIDLYDGIAYSQTEAASISAKIDFAYNYHGGGCSTCRFFENVTDMSTRTYYVDKFSTITNSKIVGLPDSIMNDAAFQAIHSSADIDAIFTGKKIIAFTEADITNRTTDAIVFRYFAIADKNGKKGFFRISDYIANPPDGNPTPITLYIKIQR